MKRIELLAPAGDLNRLKTAVLYGADAVYIGGKQLSLRTRAGNFTIDEIKEGVKFASKYNVKVFVTVNMIPHDEDIVEVEEYLSELSRVGVSAIICASLHIMQVSKRVAPDMEVHISTQQTITNSKTIEFWKMMGADRVVLAREMTMQDIQETTSLSELPIEVFIHGGMCVNYSGRCTLSNWMTLRDANRGGCAQSCRWKYRIYDTSDKQLHIDDKLFSMSSKDMQVSSYISSIIEANVSSLKIEGRMKTAYYIATVVKAYRKLIDSYYQNGFVTVEEVEKCSMSLKRAENRPASIGFYGGIPNSEGYLYGVNAAGVIQDFCATVKGYDAVNKKALIQVRNYFTENTKFEILSPYSDELRFVVEKMNDDKGNRQEIANKPMQLLYIDMPHTVYEDDMLFRVELGK